MVFSPSESKSTKKRRLKYKMARGNFGRYNAKDVYKFFKTSTRILLERCVLVRVSRGKKLSSLFSVVERFLCTEK